MSRVTGCCRRSTAGHVGLAGALRLVLLLTASGLSASASGAGFTNWVGFRDAGVVRQERDYSCGVAALATYLTHYWRQPVAESDLLELLVEHGETWALPADWREQGVSWRVLQRMAGHFQLQVAGLSVTPELLFSLRVPALVRLRVRGQPHFSLLRGVDPDGRVQLADPSWGNQVFSREAFLALWLVEGGQGSVMLMHPEPGSHLAPRSDYFGVRPQRARVKPPPA